MLHDAAFTDWLTGISGALVFIATGALAVVALLQMQKLSGQAKDEALALDKQITATLEQGEAIREAARAQLQPIVFAHPTGAPVRGPDDHPRPRGGATWVPVLPR